LNLTHEESREKKYEFELSWISEKTNFIHQSVPQNLIDAAVEKAVAAIEEDQMG
jgi:20S proteasome subunit alpha 7